MANWSTLKASVAKLIKTNGNQEITGQLLQNVLNSIIHNVGQNATFAGIATLTTNPGTPDGPVFYLATTAGTYPNFSGIEVLDGEAVIFEWNNGAWTKKVTGFATKEKLSELGSKLCVINAGMYSQSTKYGSFAEALKAIPKKDRIRRSILYFTGMDYSVNIYIYISNSTDDKEWINEEYWIPIYNGWQIDSLLDVITKNITELGRGVDKVNETQEQHNKDLKKLEVKSESVIKEYNRLPVFAFFNGENSYAKIKPITLSTNGDSFEAKVSPNLESTNSSYGFAYRNNIYNIGIG